MSPQIPSDEFADLRLFSLNEQGAPRSPGIAQSRAVPSRRRLVRGGRFFAVLALIVPAVVIANPDGFTRPSSEVEVLDPRSGSEAVAAPSTAASEPDIGDASPGTTASHSSSDGATNLEDPSEFPGSGGEASLPTSAPPTPSRAGGRGASASTPVVAPALAPPEAPPTPSPTTPPSPPPAPPPLPPAPPGGGTIHHVARGGSGDCSSSSPCGSIGAAYGRAAAGDVIQLSSGHYGGETLRASPPGNGQVVVRPAPGHSVTTGSLEIHGPALRIESITVNGIIGIRPGANRVTISNVTVNGSVYIGSADDVQVLDSTIKPSRDNDGIQIKRQSPDRPVSRRVLVARNQIGPIVASPNTTHIDGIQLLGAHDVVIESNNIFRCASQCIIGGGSEGNQRLRIQSNRIELSHDNGGYNALNLQNIPDLKIVRNNIVHGAVELNGSDPGLLLDGNTIPLLRDCGPWAVNNVIRETSCASQLPPSNRVG